MNKLANDNIQKSFELLKDMIKNKDVARFSEIAHPDAVFRSPVSHSDYHSDVALKLALTNVAEVFENLTYHRYFFSEDGMSLTMEFSASIGEKKLKGVDIIQFDENGKIIAFEVMVRPLSALIVLAEEMAKRIGATIPNFKKG